MNKTSNKELKISIFTTKWGHFSIAKGIEDLLKDSNANIYMNSIKLESLSDHSYSVIYRLFPQFYKVPFKIANHSHISKLAKSYFKNAYKKDIKSIFDKQKPHVVINTYLGFIPVLEEIAQKYPFLNLNVVADPRTFHPLEISTTAYNLLFDKKAIHKCKKFGAKENKCIVSGWFVRKEFQENYNKLEVREELVFQPETLTFCIIGGSEGAYGILKILPALLNPSNPLQVVIICGNNTQLLNAVRGFVKINKIQNNGNVTFTPIGFSEKIDRYIKSSDLVIGKAGPNLLFETVATKTPFFAISHISGQEDGNLEIINENNLGYVEENPVKANKILKEIIRNPQQLQKFEKSLIKMANYNSRASSKLKKFIGDKLT